MWSWVRVLNNEDNVMQWMFNEDREYDQAEPQYFAPTVTATSTSDTVTLEWEAEEGMTYTVAQREGWSFKNLDLTPIFKDGKAIVEITGLEEATDYTFRVAVNLDAGALTGNAVTIKTKVKEDLPDTPDVPETPGDKEPGDKESGDKEVVETPKKPTTPVKTDSPTKPATPKTGISTGIGYYSFALISSLSGLGLVLKRKKRIK